MEKHHYKIKLLLVCLSIICGINRTLLAQEKLENSIGLTVGFSSISGTLDAHLKANKINAFEISTIYTYRKFAAGLHISYFPLESKPNFALQNYRIMPDDTLALSMMGIYLGFQLVKEPNFQFSVLPRISLANLEVKPKNDPVLHNYSATVSCSLIAHIALGKQVYLTASYLIMPLYFREEKPLYGTVQTFSMGITFITTR